MNYSIKKEDRFSYIEEGKGDVLLLLHGLFGALSNYTDLIEHFKNDYTVVVPSLPIFELPRKELSVASLMEYVYDFIEYKGYKNVHVLGNSLGGHIALLLVLKDQSKFKSLILTGSSGLYENAMGDSYPRRQSYEFIKMTTESTFYDSKIATKELVDEVFETVNNPERALSIVITAKSAIRHNLETELENITLPTLLIWGKDDIVTPAFVGEDFNKGIKNSTLHLLDQCGHAPMMEKPQEFINILGAFLNK